MEPSNPLRQNDYLGRRAAGTPENYLVGVGRMVDEHESPEEFQFQQRLYTLEAPHPHTPFTHHLDTGQQEVSNMRPLMSYSLQSRPVWNYRNPDPTHIGMFNAPHLSIPISLGALQVPTSESYSHTEEMSQSNSDRRQSVSNATTWEEDDDDGQVRCEMPDLFYAHNGEKYRDFEEDCTLAYNDFNSFLKNSLTKHFNHDHMTAEGITEDQYERARRRPLVPKSLNRKEREQLRWRTARNRLFGTDMEEPIPECRPHAPAKSRKAERRSQKRRRTKGTEAMADANHLQTQATNAQTVQQISTMYESEHLQIPPTLPGGERQFHTYPSITVTPVAAQQTADIPAANPPIGASGRTAGYRTEIATLIQNINRLDNAIFGVTDSTICLQASNAFRVLLGRFNAGAELLGQKINHAISQSQPTNARQRPQFGAYSVGMSRSLSSGSSWTNQRSMPDINRGAPRYDQPMR